MWSLCHWQNLLLVVEMWICLNQAQYCVGVSHTGGSLFGESFETISLIPLIMRVTLGGTMLPDSVATMRTLLTIIMLTGLVQSTTRCLYSWHLMHLATWPILRILFFGTLVSVTYFNVFILNIIPEWGVFGTKYMGLGNATGLFHHFSSTGGVKHEATLSTLWFQYSWFG